ncbi:hypothetical protein, partial [Pseudomonas syringae]|uniref:hypothetical protein n=1 Tax=Pseudomonas syringae TaxID=317 RepID=UPI001E40D774
RDGGCDRPHPDLHRKNLQSIREISRIMTACRPREPYVVGFAGFAYQGWHAFFRQLPACPPS